MAREIDATGSYFASNDKKIIMWVMGLPRDPSYNFDLTPEQAAKLIDELTTALHRKSLEFVDKS